MIDLRPSQPQQNPEHLTVSALLLQAHREIHTYPHKQPTTNTCAFELFRRAIGQRDEQAWAGLYELYHALVGSWIVRLAPALSPQEREALTIETFAKFATSVGPHKFGRFADVGALLAYLKCCTRSVTLDDRRAHQARQREVPLESVAQELLYEDVAGSVADALAAQELWHVIARAAPAHEERLILVLVCALGWSSAELQHRYPLLFPSVEDVYRRKRNVMERLRRNKELLWLLERQSSRTSGEVQHAS